MATVNAIVKTPEKIKNLLYEEEESMSSYY